MLPIIGSNMLIFNIIGRLLNLALVNRSGRFQTTLSNSPTHFPLTPSLQMLLDSLLMRLDELDYHLPSSQIAQKPLDRRDSSRLLELSRSEGGLSDHLFANLPELLRGNERLVLNNTRVIPARLFGRRA